MTHNDKPLKSGMGLMGVLIILCALVLGVAYPMWWTSPPVTTPDAPGYLTVAQDLEEHGSLTQLHFRAPGYPALLVLTGSTHSLQRVLFYVMLALYFASTVLLLDILRRFQCPGWALTLTCLILLSPPFVEPTILYHTEIPTAFFLVGSLWLIVSNLPAWLSGTLAGVLVGLAALTRPVYQVFALPLCLFLAVNRQVGKSLLLLFMALLIVGGFATYNLWNFGYFGITPAIGWNLSTKTARFVERNADARTRAILLEGRDAALLQDGAHDAVMYIWKVDKNKLSQATGLHGTELDSYMLKLNLQLIQASPIGYVTEVGISLVNYWLPVSGPFANNNSRMMQTLWSIMHLVLVAVFFTTLLAVLGTALTQKLRLPFDAQASVYYLGLLYLFYTAIISSTLDTGSPRYRIPTDGILLATTVFGIAIWRRLRGAGSGDGHTERFRA